MKKRLLILVCVTLLLIAAISLAACNNTQTPNADNTAKLELINGATIDGETVYLSVAPDTDSVSIGVGVYKVIVTDGCKWKLYADYACESEIENNIATGLQDGYNRFYILVSTADGSVSNRYALNIYRNFFATVSYYVAGKRVRSETVISHTAIPAIEPVSRMGYIFKGWNRNGRVVEKKEERVDAILQVRSEMEPFEFESTENTCVITGVKDKTVESLVVPDYVTRIDGLALNGCDRLVRLKLPFVGEAKDSEYNNNFGYIFGAGTGRVNSKWVPASLREVEITGGTKIADDAFYGCDKLISVVLGDGITKIYRQAFQKCTFLESVRLPATLKEIGYQTFADCERLRSVDIPDSVTSVGVQAFQNCKGLKSVGVGSGIYILAKEAFQGCSAITSLTIRNGVVGIGESAFSGCSSLTSVTVPESVRTIGDMAFVSCSRLATVNLNEGLVSIGSNAFLKCVSLEELTIPQTVTTIGAGAFGECESFVSMTIPNTVTNLNTSHLFRFCESLESVTLPVGIDTIDTEAFYGCSSLSQISIPSGVLSIGNSAFAYSGLTSISLNNGMARIGDMAFMACAKLVSVSLPNSMREIGDNAFQFCPKLEDINIPSGVARIGDGTFAGCAALTQIELPDSVRSIGEGAFSGAGLIDIVIPEGVAEIGEGAFAGCINLENIYCHAESKPSGWSADWAMSSDATVVWGYTALGGEEQGNEQA